MLTIQDIRYRIAGRLLFEDAAATIPTGHRVGLVGRNGTGKTTLINLIAEGGTLEAGEISTPRSHRIGILPQEAPGGPDRLIDRVLAADVERSSLLVEAETAEDPNRIAEIHTRLADLGAHRAPARAAAILAGLGFDEIAQQRRCSEFSGGWRMRVALAAVLFAEPDLLLLDEPTNHLDLEATMWLEAYLAAYPHTLVIVSHDRILLNRSVSHILHLEDGKLTLYSGGYDRFERTRAAKLELQSKMRVKQEAERRHIQAFVDRFRYQASKARQAQSRLIKLSRMEPIASVVEAQTPRFHFPEPDSLAPPMVTLEGVSVGYTPGQPVLEGIDLRMDPEDRIALIGANGNGKSTFAKLISGRLKAENGRLKAAGKLKIGYFAQHQLDELRPGETAFQHMRRLVPDLPNPKVRALLGPFGLSGDKADTPVEVLSGGEKARLVLSLICRTAPHLLILDEPTNHLDIDARQALVQSLNEFSGAVVLISHDSHLIDLVADQLWLVDGGTVAPFAGDLEDYRRHLLEARRSGRRERQNGELKRDRKEARRAAATARAALADHRKRAKQAEKQIAKLTADKAEIEAELAAPETYNGSTDRLALLGKKKSAIEARLAETEAAWLDAVEILEAAKRDPASDETGPQ